MAKKNKHNEAAQPTTDHSPEQEINHADIEAGAPVAEPEAEATSQEPSLYDYTLDHLLAAEPGFARQHPKEDAQLFLRRFVGALGALSDESYQQLPKGAKVWYNECADAMTAEKACPLLEGYTGSPASAPAAAGRKGNGDALAKYREEQKRLKAEAIANGTAVAKAPKAVKAPAGPKVDGIVATMRKILLRNPAMTAEEMVKAGEAAGFSDLKSSTIAAIRTDTLATYNILKDMGLLS